VRQSAKREKAPDVLELWELQLPLSKLAVRERTLALLDAATGLRVSELLALRWSDVDFEKLELRVTRSIWHQVVGNCKTEASAKPVPMDSYMAEDLLSWRRQSIYSSNDDYVFASETMRGRQPYWPDNLIKRHIRPVANDYIEDLMTPTVEEIQDARPLATVLPERVMARATLVAIAFCTSLPHNLPN
jgi:integrase